MAVFLIVCLIINIGFLKKLKKISEREVEWLLQYDVEDNTEEHLHNLNENWQFTKEYLWYAKKDYDGDYTYQNAPLYRINRSDGTKEKILDEVNQFVLMGDTLYYTKIHENNGQKLYLYDIKKEQKKVLLSAESEKYSFHRWITIEDNKIIYTADIPRDYGSYSYICSCDLSNGKMDIIMEYEMRDSEDSVIYDDNIFTFLGGGLYKYCLKEIAGKRIIYSRSF